MSYDLKIFAIKLASTLIAAPFFGWGIMLYAEMLEKSWKTSKRRGKWVLSCGIFLIIAVISGWLR